MMIKNIYQEPAAADYPTLCSRPTLAADKLDELMGQIFSAVADRGDNAVRDYSRQFDKVELESFAVGTSTVQGASSQLSSDLKTAIQRAADNIRTFHSAQMPADINVTTSAGIVCSQRAVPIDSVGIYIPGGTAPLLSTVLMLAIPAQVAACRRVVLCTPPSSDGGIDPAIAYCADLCGVTEMYAVGGAHAIAAMSIGTETIAKVDKVFGPGNQYVAAAKVYASRYGTAMDIPAGPSELLVYADDTCVPAFVAADLLSQAEHGEDSQVVLVTSAADIVTAVNKQLARQIESLPRKTIAAKALTNSRAIIIEEVEKAWQYINTYAPEHLIIASAEADQYVPYVRSAGSVFLGNYSPESVGDYATGTNHTLPTDGWARSYSGVNMDAYLKKVTFQQLTASGLRDIGPTVVAMAEAETLQAHANAVSIRLQTLNT